MNPEIFVASSHFREDVSWIPRLGLPYFVVSKGEFNPPVDHFHVIPNKGAEFGSYLWFILDRWHRMPHKVAFIHGHLDSYHQQHSIPVALQICDESDFRGLNGECSLSIHRLDAGHPWFGNSFRDAWNFLGLDSIRRAPDFAVFQPGTQTLVSGELILSRSMDFYKKIFDALMTHREHYFLALVLEIAWQTIFGFDPLNSSIYEEFSHVFEKKELSILIAHPTQVWHSGMKNVVFFEPQDNFESWIHRCLGAFEKIC